MWSYFSKNIHHIFVHVDRLKPYLCCATSERHKQNGRNKRAKAQRLAWNKEKFTAKQNFNHSSNNKEWFEDKTHFYPLLCQCAPLCTNVCKHRHQKKIKVPAPKIQIPQRGRDALGWIACWRVRPHLKHHHHLCNHHMYTQKMCLQNKTKEDCTKLHWQHLSTYTHQLCVLSLGD